MTVPVVDLFAGPGGLGEGFSSLKHDNGEPRFKIALSVEMNDWAHRTLELRSFFRQFGSDEVPEAYYRYLRGEIDRACLFNSFPLQAKAAHNEAWKAELGAVPAEEIDHRIEVALSGREDWVLVGGPPCQAYSVIGRSKMKRMKIGDSYNFEDDHRHFLYREYLRILRRHSPPVFVMENVKGLLSSQNAGKNMFEKICRDLRRRTPQTPGYNIYSFVKESNNGSLDPEDYVIYSENYGIPQMRHRVILLGIRKDLPQRHSIIRKSESTPTTRDAIRDLPRLRSLLSREPDSFRSWLSALRETPSLVGDSARRKTLLERIDRAIRNAERGRWNSRGDDRFHSSQNALAPTEWMRDNAWWFNDPGLGSGACNHGTRAHMRSDISRYLFAASYASVTGTSPFLRNFPEGLLPAHANVSRSLSNDNFADRFRVQVAGKASTTVLSHIAKDGHYYIHYDPGQCRSMTVREVARLQTFPDNYFFEGPRTQQYYQVGNAVPPLLARQLAEIVKEIVENR
jgi:DNA (cytosine-5)-methyltransferase 1